MENVENKPKPKPITKYPPQCPLVVAVVEGRISLTNAFDGSRESTL